MRKRNGGLVLLGVLSVSLILLAALPAKAGARARLRCDPPCDDGDACTVDTCNRICADSLCNDFIAVCNPDHPPVDCDDGNACTVNSCDPELGCLSEPLDCDDGDPCTVDSCNEDGCDNAPVDDGATCDDDDYNTINDTCVAGVCEGALASCPCWDGELTITEGLGFLGGDNLLEDPDPVCGFLPPPANEWDVFCTSTLSDARYAHPEMCDEIIIYGSIIQRRYIVSDMMLDDRRCEARIEDVGYYSMFTFRSFVDNLTQTEFDDCMALVRQQFTCP